ncbi:MAG: hypothetical protein GF333_05135 [Candidatus Omnitrophica bacterium]|nr:hypothetical protein [Candidatus Omnitrophota bacterium]
MQKDILSPKEIEALVKKEDPSYVKGKMVSPYDFRTPELLSKEKYRMFQLLMEEFANKLKSFLSTQFKVSFDMEISSIRQGVFREVQESGDQAFMVVFNTPPLEGNSLLELRIPFILFFHQVLLGKDPEKFPQPRKLTAVEEETGHYLADKFFLSFQEAFAKLVQFSYSVVSVERNPKLLFLASPEEPVILVTLQFSKKSASSEATFCFPYMMFDSLLPYLDFKKWFFIAQRKKDKITDERIRNNIEKIDIDLVCQMGEIELPLKDLLDLEEGDYLRLDRAADDLLEMTIGGHKKFEVKPGKIKGKSAVRIDKILKD